MVKPKKYQDITINNGAVITINGAKHKVRTKQTTIIRYSNNILRKLIKIPRPISIRNCLLAFGYIYSEKKIRDYTNTSRDSGTNERKIFRALKKLGFSYKEFFNKSEQAFRQRIIYNLKKGNKIIILTDHEDHWISVVDYSNKKLEVIDPERTRIRIELTPKELGQLICRK